MTGEGLADVLCGERSMRSDMPLERAVRFVRERRRQGDKVYREDLDGDRTDISREV